MVTSSSNLLNDTQYQVLTMLLGDPLHCVFPVTPPEGEKTLSVLSLPEREKTPCVQSPRGEGKISYVQPPPEGVKTLVILSQDTPKLVQSKSVFILEKDLPVGGQTQTVPSGVGKTWVPPVDHRAHKRRIQVALQGTPKAIQGTRHNQQLCRLRQTKCLMDLYSRPAAERRSQSRSYPRKSGSKTRQLLEASHRLEFTKQIPGHPKVQDGDPRVHTCLPQERGMGHIYRSHRCLLTRANSHPVLKIPRVSFQRRHLPVHQPPLRASHRSPSFSPV